MWPSAVDLPVKSTMKNRISQLNYIVNTLIELLSVQFIRVRGRSMEPAIGANTWVVVFKAGFRKREPQRFDVVRLEDPHEPNHWIIKRIVGLPGEEVALIEGELFVNGEQAADPHAFYPDSWPDPASGPSPDSLTGNQEWWLRDAEYVVLGDNRSASTDSRTFGPVKRSSIRGRVRG